MGFEASYLALRDKEGRRFSDAQLRALPEVAPGHLHPEEWRLRSLSCVRLLTWLGRRAQQMKKRPRVLEVGCGIGWLAHRMAAHAEVTATDVLEPEIEQARRAFRDVEGLRFVLVGLDAAELRGQQFDAVLFPASLQYFADPAAVIASSLQRAPEVHVLDSPFYADTERAGAQERSARHFTALGHPELADHYHPLSRSALAGFSVESLYEPIQGDTPFPWLRLVIKSAP